jgi:23S rRNA (uridine2552-2'-O)-methyltransferase
MPARSNCPDHFTRRAKVEGRPARSVYKLEEMDKRWHLLKPGQRILDLGAAPGSWLQYAAQRVGAHGFALGVDIKAMTVSLPSWAQVMQGDVFDMQLSQRFDVVLSDMAPATMGDHKTDAMRSANLAERALDVASTHLRVGGHVVVKLLEGGDVVQLAARLRREYGKLERLRPQATRRHSSEIFLVGLGKLCPPAVESI